VLSRVADAVLAVHGQNDQLRLQRPAEQRAVLDRYAGETVAVPLDRYRAVRQRWRTVSQDLITRREGARQLAREADMLRHGLAEIDQVNPLPGEDGALVEEAKRLAAADDLRTAAGAARGALTGADGAPDDGGGDQPGVQGLLGTARGLLAESDDPELARLAPRLAELDAVVVDVASELTGYLDMLDADPERLQHVLARQAELRALTRKYAADVDGVLKWASDARDQLAGIDTSDEALEALRAEQATLAAELAGHAQKVSAARRDAAKLIAQEVTGELAGLAMPNARLEVRVHQREQDGDGQEPALEVAGQRLHAGPDGVDEVEFRLVSHGGANAVPLHKGASGGELSRVMLALEVVLAGADPVPTMVFDEVDAGVGGRAAVEIGRRLARLAASHQVIVVTHLAQVAAYADRHVVVDKATDRRKGTTSSRVRTLSDGDRIVELARMLAGLDDTSTGRAHAEELLATADRHKNERS
jgi:DNA repair protein RecN (Recombination protein N)